MIIGHPKIVESLRQKIGKHGYSQAYIFSGPEGVGKRQVAEVFARGIIRGKDFLALSSEEESEAELDMLRLRPETEEKKGVIKEKEISIAQVRSAQKELATFPYSGKAKVLIVDDSDRMNARAQNAMLKTMEEPNSTSVIILVSSRPEKLLATVRSRCQTVNFNLVDSETLVAYLQSNGSALGREAVGFSMGRPGILLGMIQDPKKVGWYRASEQKMAEALDGGLNRKLKIAEEFSKNIPEALLNLNFWSWALRRSGTGRDIERAGKIQEAVDKLKDTNISARLMLENLFLNSQ